MNKKLLPHFLIIGAPKCGTTALHYYLSQHPELNLSPKEIHFFGKDLGYKVNRPTLDEYQSHFKETGLNGDGSVWYLYSDSIYQELSELNIHPKIIVLLRNPIEVSYALHSQNIVDANENVSDFEKALQLEDIRKKGDKLPPYVDPPRTVYYKETGNFLPRIKKLYDNIPRKDIFIGLQSELKSNTEQFVKKVEQFLGISNYNSYNFEPVNENKIVKNKKLHRYIKKPATIHKKLFRTFIPSRTIRKWAVDKVYSSNLKHTKRQSMSEKTKQKLKSYFYKNNELLNKIIDCDVSSWND
ncbi:MAG: hypothetical protein CMD35_00615 [Flavobacteriales bacterium]|nr:hypothetical protein [Flavobacteriales bacterium]|tara:strand:+ start:8583 stop:9476 length:894 start_codon:yes stop_codon:yes gene_type:complete